MPARKTNPAYWKSCSNGPLHKLVKRGHCELCFDLVPDIRVEG